MEIGCVDMQKKIHRERTMDTKRQMEMRHRNMHRETKTWRRAHRDTERDPCRPRLTDVHKQT